DRNATKMIGKSANGLQDDLYETSNAANYSSYPMEINKIVDKTYMIKVDVKSSNCENQHQVYNVITFIVNEDLIKKYDLFPPSKASK
ncbi:hypothetical protein HAX54_029997, partial [Datura stramonium]|nr:hypothetical protein [Datura stramonium]